MTMAEPNIELADAGPVTWWRCEPRRLARDQQEVAAFCPDLEWSATGAGSWHGRLPIWPFARPKPHGVEDLVDGKGLLVQVVYGHAYPMVPAAIFPLDPEPEVVERTQHQWHVNGDGSLCLMQTDAAWTGRDSVTGLLLKAAGWRIEYVLMKHGLISVMSTNGIVEDPVVDPLIVSSVAERSVEADVRPED
jgi:hypothetical protein